MAPTLDKLENDKLRRRAEALADFGTFAFREPDLQRILEEAARVCAKSLGVTFSKICQIQPGGDDLRVVAGCGWHSGVVGYALSVADETSPQGRAFATGEPQFCANIEDTDTYVLPPFYAEHAILSTIDVIVAAKQGIPFGVLEVDSPVADAFDTDDVIFLTSFANILAEAVASASRSEEMKTALGHLKELVAEKDLLSQELKHRVRNSLHLVYGLLNAELDGQHAERSLAAIRAISQRVMGLAEIFDHLLGNGMSKVISFGDYASALCRNLPALYGDQDIRLIFEADPFVLNLDDATAMGVIITELVNNAYMHAFPDKVGEIKVALHLSPGADVAVLTISDNGIGFAEVETTRRGMGLVRRLVKQVGGSLTLQSDHGSTWTMTLPVQDPPNEPSLR